MKKDAESLKSSGGTGVQSKTFDPKDLTQDAAFVPPVDAASKAAVHKGRALFISIAIIVVLALAGAATYFFVLPLFSPSAPETVVDEAPIEEEAPQPPIGPAFVHQSFFAGIPDVSTNVVLSTASLGDIIAAMQESAATEGALEEFAFTVNGEPMMTKEVVSLLLPNLDSTIFNQDFTTFLYHDENGTWPGYVFLLAEGADANSAALTVSDEIEKSANLSAFYLAAPGAADEGGFQDGSVSGISTRYLPLGIPGASFNYGWSGRHLILSTSFEGIQRAAGLLGG